jgi:CheY-like chemotaxis protein
MSRTFDRRKDAMAHRVGGWIPIPRDPAPGEHTLSNVPKSAPALSAVRVMVVDDDVRAADSLEVLLHAGGYAETRVAYTAHGALAIARDFRPAIALIELDMRDMDSCELSHALWEHAPPRGVRLIAVTESRAQGDRQCAHDARFEGYLFKPITAADLALCMKTDRLASSHRVSSATEAAK